MWKPYGFPHTYSSKEKREKGKGTPQLEWLWFFLFSPDL